jgi:hypothetical protein
MPVSPILLQQLITAVQAENSLAAYQAASQLEKLKPEMTDEQRADYEAALAGASHERQAKAKAEADAAACDEWDQDEN